MKKFENFLAASVIQNTTWDYKQLHQRAEKLFKGKDSLPRRLNALKRAGAYADNLLIQELTPMLQIYNEESKQSTVDGLRLFNKKLQPYDVDLLSDAFLELKEINPELANDLIVFSALQSGYEFSPNSFFQVIPGTEVLEFLSKYFNTNKKEDRTSNLLSKANMNSLWDDFHRNYYYDNKIIPNLYLAKIATSKETGRPMVIRSRQDEYISVTTPTGKESIGGREITTYETKLFKASTKLDNGSTVYYAENTKGVKGNLIEATGTETASIVNKNVTFKSDLTVEEPVLVNTVLELKTNVSKETDDVIEDKNCK